MLATIKAALVALAVTAMLLVAAPQAGAGSPTTNHPTVGKAIRVVSKPGDPTPRNVNVQLTGRKRAWGINRAARRLDRRIGGLRIHVHGNCRTRPWAQCVAVRVVNRPRVDWWGLAVYANNDGHYRQTERRRILLNRAYGRSRGLALHELAHIIGMYHHRERGAVGYADGYRRWLSPRERRAFNRAY